MFATLQWRPHLSPLWCGLLIAAVAVWLWYIHRRMLTRVDERRARWLLLPKILLTLLLLTALFEPVWMVEKQENARGKILALVDASSSMEVVDDGKLSRLTRARSLVQKLKKDFPSDIQIDELDFNTEPVKAGDGTKGPAPRGTDIGGVLVALAERKDINAYLGAVLLTDGGDEKVEGNLLPPIPLFAIGISAPPETWSDVAIVDVSHPPSVEKGIEFEVNVDIEARMGTSKTFVRELRSVPVTLEEQVDGNWRVLDTKNLNLENRRARARFNATNRDLGLRNFRVKVQPVRGEVTELNNVRHFAVEAQKKSLHLLYFSRELGMDFKMLRSELARDPGIAFTALFRTMSEKFTLQGERFPGDEDLEAGFPANLKTLQLYDCIVLGSFPAEDWTPEQIKTLVKYVEEGGVVIFMGGNKSYGLGGYAKTEMAALFPWQVADNEPDMLTGMYPIKVPPSAMGHPMLGSVEETVVREGAVIESLHQLGDLKPGATVLLETRLGNRSVPVVAMQNFGKGRILALASNTLWKWMVRSEMLKAAHGMFWRQAVRNLTGKEEGGRFFSVKWDKDAYRPGEQASPEIRVAGQTASEGIRFTASLTAKTFGTPVSVEPLQGQVNTWTAKVRLKERGNYFFKLTAMRGENVLETYEKVLRIAPLVDEGAHLDMDEAFLKKLTERGSGAFYRETETDQFVKRVSTGFGRKKISVEASLAQAGPWFAFIFILILLAEWIMRRRMNLI
ncbi:MAG: glutamine amidotransferase [Verrucomicrobiota bacterium]